MQTQRELNDALSQLDMANERLDEVEGQSSSQVDLGPILVLRLEVSSSVHCLALSRLRHKRLAGPPADNQSDDVNCDVVNGRILPTLVVLYRPIALISCFSVLSVVKLIVTYLTFNTYCLHYARLMSAVRASIRFSN